MATNHEINVEGLNHLVTIANDGEKGYNTAAEQAHNPILKAAFLRMAVERAEFAVELKGLVRLNGGDPDTGGGPVGALHRAWIDIKTALSSDDDKAILNECITGDKAAVNAYETELKDTYLPVEHRAVLERQLKIIKDALFTVESELRQLE
ncbi:PA2169 family four-helix-bundle protein [Mucilaginibacter sp. RS28]|uniref:PA2169 family four-helix-bundle protein n=1 Tax=Mucilaginibacter straminoryzae TaxID=2932774 RepID=A0A9X2BBP3_9SPHI|nr:PA2169 family four-helix-bundle protein [Mucilaginibacter straminoryzae]MCJ8210062.1 PA2169 family four-helix-bundle protein [Mucilaginibacter straminoryzae]